MLEGKRIGFCITGSYCTFETIIPLIQKLVDLGADVTPIVSFAVDKTDTRFYKADDFKAQLESITGKKIIKTIPEAEPIGPKKLLDIVVVTPCTGNTLSKLANSITDTPVTMAVKAHLRNGRPVVLGVSTNDALSGSAKNIGMLLNMKDIYFVPFFQDDPDNKGRSLIFNGDMMIPAMESAMQNKQIQPVLWHN